MSEVGCQILAEKDFNFKLERTFFPKNCFASPGNKRRERNERASGWLLQVGLIVPSIKMQHRKVSLGGVDSFLCLKHGLLASNRDIKCAVLFLENEIVYPGERQLQNMSRSADYKELKTAFPLPSLKSWAEHHCFCSLSVSGCCVFTNSVHPSPLFKSLGLPSNISSRCRMKIVKLVPVDKKHLLLALRYALTNCPFSEFLPWKLCVVSCKCCLTTCSFFIIILRCFKELEP